MSRVPSTVHLAPGLRVVRRGLHHLQVGLYDDRRVLLPHTEAVRRTIALLLERRAPSGDPEAETVLQRLERHGCLTRGVATRPTPVRVALLGAPGRSPAEPLLAACGLVVTSTVDEADVVVVATAGETDRDLLDPLVRRRIPHLVVRLVDGGAILGPFVVPGRSACLRCVDAHRSLADPHHVEVTTRYVRATSRARPDGIDDVADPALLPMVAGWAARDVLAHAAGTEPSTWSRTLRWGPEPGVPHEQQWRRHPECGCSWEAALV